MHALCKHATHQALKKNDKQSDEDETMDSPIRSPKEKDMKKKKMREQAEEEKMEIDSEVEPVQLHVDQAGGLQKAAVKVQDWDHLSQGSPSFNPDDWPEDGVNVFSHPEEDASKASAPAAATPRKTLPPPMHKRKMEESAVKQKPAAVDGRSSDEDLDNDRVCQEDKKSQAYQEASG